MPPQHRWSLAVVAAYLVVSLCVLRCVPPRSDVEIQLVETPLAPGELLADLTSDGGTQQRLGVPRKPEAWQKPPPCDEDFGEVALFGACYVKLEKKPPCGKLREYNGGCFRGIAKAPRPPSSVIE